MDLMIIWNIGQEAAAQGSLKGKPYRAFFYWTQNGQTIKTADFTKSELETEIARLLILKEDVTEFEAALRRLNRLQGAP